MPTPLCSLQLAKDSSRAKQFVRDSQPYLRSPQAPIREAALRFIGESQPPGSLFGQRGPFPPSPGVAKGRASVSLCPLPTQLALVAALPSASPGLLRGSGRAGGHAAGSTLGSRG